MNESNNNKAKNFKVCLYLPKPLTMHKSNWAIYRNFLEGGLKTECAFSCGNGCSTIGSLVFTLQQRLRPVNFHSDGFSHPSELASQTAATMPQRKLSNVQKALTYRFTFHRLLLPRRVQEMFCLHSQSLQIT